MNSKFETFIENLLLESLKSDESKCDSVLPTGNEHINKEFRLILDRMATALIHNTFDNERLVKALMKLSSTERIVIVFNIVLGMQMS